ncbi:unnamed protein product, partial [Discosporangium mesarthrocarpum]
GKVSSSPWGGDCGDGLVNSGAQGSPVKKRGGGRWRLSGGDGAGGGSPLRGHRNPFSPDIHDGDAGGGDAIVMPAPAPRRQQQPLGTGGSPMDTGLDLGTGQISTAKLPRDESSSSSGDDASFLHRASLSSSSSSSTLGAATGAPGSVVVPRGKVDLTRPSPTDVTAFVPVTPMPYRENLCADDLPMSPAAAGGVG